MALTLRQVLILTVIGAIVLLTVGNAGLQVLSHYSFYDQQRRALDTERGAMNKELRLEFNIQRASLAGCRTELEGAREELDMVSRRLGDDSERWMVEKAELIAERDNLRRQLRASRDRLEEVDSKLSGSAAAGAMGQHEGSVSFVAAVDAAQAAEATCQQQLGTAVRELKRFSRVARQRALDSQAVTARLNARVQVVASRARIIQSSSKKIIESCNSDRVRFDAAMRLHAEQIQKVAEDIGMEVTQTDALTFAKDQVERAVRQESAKAASSAEKGKRRRHPRPRPRPPQVSETSEGGEEAIVPSTHAGLEEKPCVAAVVPFRGRGVHLGMFGAHIGRFLESPEASRLCWSIFIVEQYDADLFNRGWLFNVGLALADTDRRKFKCVIIQDLDTLPELGAGVDFADCDVPTQLSSEIECYGWLPPYAGNAGGVVSLTSDHWHQINGFSNEYEGWGGEDDDFRLRLRTLGLLRGDCGSYCNLTDRAFMIGQKGLIRRPKRGKGRFICLEESSHTPRKHGDMKAMQGKLREMDQGSDRWAYDGLSNLHFDILRHERRHFSNGTHGGEAMFHWLKVVPSSGDRFRVDRIRLVLDAGVCSSVCQREGRCIASPTSLPFALHELQAEFARAFQHCMAEGDGDVERLGYWLIDRRLVHTAVYSMAAPALSFPHRRVDPHSDASWALNEVLRTALDSVALQEPDLVVRALPIASFQESLAGFRKAPERMQAPIVSVCVGVYKTMPDVRLTPKYTVNVGSDDCEQRSWTHFASFKALKEPRVPADRPYCIGEAKDTWTIMVHAGTDCSRWHMGIEWFHKGVFYIGDDARGEAFCVRFKNETGDLQKWTRWQILPQRGAECISSHRYTREFSFRSFEDTYRPKRVYLCALLRPRVALSLDFDCDAVEASASGNSAFAVYRYLQPDAAGADPTEPPDLYCIGRSPVGDRIARGSNCTMAELGVHYAHVVTFQVPESSTGPPWCVGRQLPEEIDGSPGESLARFLVRRAASCSEPGSVHLFSFREVALEDVDEELGILSLQSM